jgi:hypothetical protein
MTKIRCVDKATSKKHKDRFFNALLGGYDGETAGKLAKADQILISGTLAIQEYKSKKTGQMVQSDEMGFGTRILQVVKSPTFFGDAQVAPPATDEPAFDPTAVTAGPGPLDGIEL